MTEIARFSRYQILRELGRGGMGVVYEAYDSNLKRHVALKILAQLAAGDKDKERFARESSLIAKLDHPHIVRVFDVGEEQGRNFFTMELVTGVNFNELLKANLPLAQLLKILTSVCLAVQYAHEQNIIHRDLKPSNIMVANDNQPKVMDFGLAKELGGKGHRLSKSQDVMGTPEYMSPEQAAGKVREVDGRSDVYSLGAILYEMLTGRPPFAGANSMTVFYQISCEEPKPPSQFYPRVDKDLEAICLKALEKEKERRYQTAFAMAEDLNAFLDGKPTKARPITPVMRGWRWIRRHALISSLVASVICLTAGMIGVVVAQVSNEARLQRDRLEFQAQQTKIEKGNATEERRLKEQAESERKAALEQKAQAYFIAAQASLSQAEAELTLARGYITNQDYYHAREHVENAKALFQGAIEQSQSLMPKELQQVNTRRQWLTTAARHMEDYCIAYQPCGAGNESAPVAITNLLQLLQEHPDYKILSLHQPSWRYVVLRHVEHKAAILWDMRDKQTVKTFPYEIFHRNSCAISPDDRFVGVGTDDGDVLIYEIATANVQRVKIKGSVESLTFSPDAKWLFGTSGFDCFLWRLADMKQVLQRPSGTRDAVRAFSSDGQSLAIGGRHSFATPVVVYDLANLNANEEGRAYRVGRIVNSLCFGPHDATLILGGNDEITVFPLKKASDKGGDNEVISMPAAHRGSVINLALSSDNNFLASVGQEGAVTVWSTHSYSRVFTTFATNDLTSDTGCRFSGQQQLSVWHYNSAKFFTWQKNIVAQYNLNSRLELRNTEIPLLLSTARNPNWRSSANKEVVVAALSPSSKHFAFCMWLDMWLWETETNTVTRLTPQTKANRNAGKNRRALQEKYVAFTGNDQTLLLQRTQEIFCWDLLTRQQFYYDNYRGRVSFAPQGNFILRESVFDDERNDDGKEGRTIEVWDTRNSKIKLDRSLSLKMGTHRLGPVANPEATKAMFVQNDYSLEVWDIVNNPPKRLLAKSLPGSSVQAQAACFDSDERLVLGGENGGLVVYDWRNDKIIHQADFYEPIIRVWHDVNGRLYWILTARTLFVYPEFSSSAAEAIARIYPLPLYAGFSAFCVDVSADFRRVAMLLQSGEIWLLKFELTTHGE